MKRISAIFLACAIVFQMSCFPVLAEPSVASCNVTRYAQEKSNWCWAASSKMIGHYHGAS